MVQHDGPCGLDGVEVGFDDERAVAHAGVGLVAMLAGRLGLEALGGTSETRTACSYAGSDDTPNRFTPSRSNLYPDARSSAPPGSARTRSEQTSTGPQLDRSAVAVLLYPVVRHVPALGLERRHLRFIERQQDYRVTGRGRCRIGSRPLVIRGELHLMATRQTVQGTLALTACRAGISRRSPYSTCRYPV